MRSLPYRVRTPLVLALRTEHKIWTGSNLYPIGAPTEVLRKALVNYGFDKQLGLWDLAGTYERLQV